MEANIQIRWIANFPVQLNECYVDTMSCIHSNFYGTPLPHPCPELTTPMNPFGISCHALPVIPLWYDAEIIDAYSFSNFPPDHCLQCLWAQEQDLHGKEDEENELLYQGRGENLPWSFHLWTEKWLAKLRVYICNDLSSLLLRCNFVVVMCIQMRIYYLP